MHLPLKIHRIREENATFRTYVFKHDLRAKPGQFAMVWLPGVDEVPMSVGWQDEGELWIGISKRGDCTTAIFDQVKIGDRLGIRGPFGKPFEMKEEYKKIILVGGGYGTPPLLFLAKEARSKNKEVTVILGAKSPEQILYEKEFAGLGCKVLNSTNHQGKKAHATEMLEECLTKEKADCVYTCGPEKMMVKVAGIAQKNGVESQASLERHMKCGFGICGQCCIDGSGARVCKDGPVFKGEEALSFEEFGHYTRTGSGKRITLE